MIDTIKKTLLAGLGATVITAERVEQAMNDLVEKGKINADEARSVAEKVVEEGKQEWEEARHDLASAFEKLLKEAHLATSAELESLTERVEALESTRAKKKTKAAS